MYLLHTSTIALHAFSESNIPEYAILSHRWEDGEVQYSDIRGRVAETMRGFSKLKGCCDLAFSAGLEYIWIDTCCIDKSSSADLSEAINSMFRWYRDARVCYVYLSDVPSDIPSEQHEQANSFFRNSAWFTRGWTLQELLAPEFVVFYDHNWHELGTKRSLRTLLSSITNIAGRFLINFTSASVAQKMSWASSRKTSRIEDTAYCLLGIFGVYLTPIYGEGLNAFRRLQVEIITKSDDQSIFAWTVLARETGGKYIWSGTRTALASHPSLFARCEDIVRSESTNLRVSQSITNRGLRLEHQLLFPAETLGVKLRENTFVAVLNCSQSADGDRLGIYLQRTDVDDEFLRTEFGRLAPCKQSLLQGLQSQSPIVYFPLEDFSRAETGTIHEHRFDVDALAVRLHGFKQMDEKHSASENTPAYSIWKFCDPEQREGFFTVVDSVDLVIGVNIFTFSKQGLWVQLRKELCNSTCYSPKDRRRFDRLSRTLPSGKTVSVALMIGGPKQHREPSDAKMQWFVVKIVISEDGELPWPDSRELVQTSASPKSLVHSLGAKDCQVQLDENHKWPGEDKPIYRSNIRPPYRQKTRE